MNETFAAPGLTEQEFLALSENFPDATLEYTTQGMVIVIPASDPESAARVAETSRQLANWAVEQGRGIVAGPDGGFRFRDGSRRSPDAVWFDADRWRAAKTTGTRYPVFAPEFVIEVRSPDQRALPLREKMEEYIANGVLLGWLIDPIERTVTTYRPGTSPQVLTNPPSVAGEGPVAGFVLHLNRILH